MPFFPILYSLNKMVILVVKKFLIFLKTRHFKCNDHKVHIWLWSIHFALFIFQKQNQDGHWIKIDPESAESFCQTKKGEFWSLVQGKEGIVYLQHEHDVKEGITPVENEPFSFASPPSGATGGFNFGTSPQIPSMNSMFGTLTPPAVTGELKIIFFISFPEYDYIHGINLF